MNSGGRLAPEPALVIATPYLLCHHEKMGTQGPRDVSERESSIMSDALREVQIGKETYQIEKLGVFGDFCQSSCSSTRGQLPSDSRQVYKKVELGNRTAECWGRVCVAS